MKWNEMKWNENANEIENKSKMKMNMKMNEHQKQNKTFALDILFCVILYEFIQIKFYN